ncbi:MAG: glycosyltransferase family 39 protein [Desulfocapsa sp.]|nr:glycosyltransferase family 39 protein [Desulfocapsa sp.]
MQHKNDAIGSNNQTVQHFYLTGLGITLLALLIRLWAPDGNELWYDELQTVTHASLPLSKVISSVLIYDPHPPLYYLQLHLWMLAGKSDTWIHVNAMAWSLLTCLSLLYIGKRLINEQAALWSGLVFALFPLAVYYAQEARMYGMIMCLTLWAFYFTDRFLHGQRPWRYATGMVMMTLGVLYSHGAAFILLACLWAYALPALQHRGKKKWAVWAMTQGALLALYAPILWHSRNISVAHTMIPDLWDFITTMDILWFGMGAFLWPPPYAAGAFFLIITILAICLTGLRRSRRTLLAFVLVPLLICIMVSYLIRPIWFYRTLLFTIPFICLMLGEGCARLAQARLHRRKIRAAVIGMVLLILATSLLNQQLTFRKSWNTREAVTWVQSSAKSGDLIVVANRRLFWCWCWYYIGPGSVTTHTNEVTTPDGVRIVNNLRSLPERIQQQKRTWVVYSTWDRAPLLETLSHKGRRDFRKLFVDPLP